MGGWVPQFNFYKMGRRPLLVKGMGDVSCDMFTCSVWADRVAKLRSLCCSAIGICAALVESAFAWRRATGERETCWCKRGVSLVSGVICGIV